MDQSNTNLLQMSFKFVRFEGLYDYFAPCKMFRIICERKHVHFTQKTYNQLAAHDHETRSTVNDKIVFPRHS